MYVCVCWSLGYVQLFVTPWTVAHQAPLSMEFSRQEYWSWLPFLSPGDLPNPGITPGSPALQADSVSSEPPGKPYLVTGIIYLQAVLTKWSLNIVNFHAFFSNNLRIIKSFFFFPTDFLFSILHSCSIAQSCPTICDPMDCSPPSSSLLGISQARILEAVAISRGIFLTQGSNLCLWRLLHWQADSLLNLLNYCSTNSLLLFTVNAYLGVLTSLLTPASHTQRLPLSPLPFFLRYVFWGWPFS